MKMRTMCNCVLLAGALATTMMTTTAASAQRVSTDIGLTLNLEHSQVAQTGTPGFWIKGGAVDGAVTFYKGLALAANFSGGHARLNPGVILNKYAFMAGPRYTLATPKKQVKVFGEALFGVAHGFDSLFPAGTGTTSSASGLSLQIGGGVNYQLQHGFGIRAVELDYVHTNLSNNAANSQNDLRVAFGLTYHLGKK